MAPSPGTFKFIDIPSSKSDLGSEDSNVFIVKPNATSGLKASADKATSVDSFVRYMFSPSAIAILRRYGLQPE